MQYRHLHPLSIFIFLRYSIFGGVIPLIFVGGIGGSLIFLIMLCYAVFYFWNFKYAVTADQIWIQRGVIIKKQEHIPLKRLQTIHHQQSLWLQPFKLETLKLATASKHGFQIKLAFVPQSVGKLVEEHYHAALQQTVAPVNETNTVATSDGSNDLSTPLSVETVADYRINVRDMNLFAATSFRILLFVALFPRYTINILNTFKVYVWPILFHWTGHGAIFVTVLLTFLIAFVVSYLSLWIQYYNFHLTRQEGYLIFSHGLFNHDTIKIREHRIQGVVLERNMIREWLGLFSVKLIMISDENGHSIKSQPVILPVIRKAEWLNFQSQFLPWIPVNNPQMSAPRQRSGWLFFRNAALLLILIASVLTYWWLQYWRLIAIALILGLPLALGNALYKQKRTRVGLTGSTTDAFLYLQTSRYLISRTIVVNWHQIQSIRFQQSVWMNKSHLAHLTINIRSGESEVKVEMRYLDASVAKRVYTWYRQFQ